VWEEISRDFYEVVAERFIRSLLDLIARVLLGKLGRHEDMFDNRTQNMRIGIIGNEDRHGHREQAYKDGEMAFMWHWHEVGAYVALLCGTEFTLQTLLF
jgi:hypothetical protein